MSAVELRAEIDALMDQVDGAFLKVVHAMLDTYVNEKESAETIGYDIKGNPILAEEVGQEYAKRVEAMKAGQKTSIEDLKKEAAEW